MSEKPDGVVILDFGGQYCHLIARRIRELKVYSEILPCDSSMAEVEALNDTMRIRGAILSGSPSSVRRDDALKLDEGVLSLGLPDSIVKRQPFPCPGLAVRIIGEVTYGKLEIMRRGDALVCEEVETSGLSEDVWQYFPVLTDTRSMGVKGDERAYGCTVAIRVVESVYGMTASFSKPPCGLLERISTRITNEVPEVTRVVYEITHKPPSTIECE